MYSCRAYSSTNARNNSLSGNRICENKFTGDYDTEGIAALAVTLEDEAIGIRDLILNHVRIGGETGSDESSGIGILGRAVLTRGLVQHVDLSNNNIGPFGIAALAETFVHCPTLIHLSLKGNILGVLKPGVGSELMITSKRFIVCPPELLAPGAEPSSDHPSGLAAMGQALKARIDLEINQVVTEFDIMSLEVRGSVSSKNLTGYFHANNDLQHEGHTVFSRDNYLLFRVGGLEPSSSIYGRW